MTIQLDYIAVGERIRQMRRDRGLTQEQLAEACGLSASFIGLPIFSFWIQPVWIPSFCKAFLPS